MNSTSPIPSGIIAIVDDEVDNLNVLEALISHAGYRTALFPRGELALAAAQAEPPDLVLLDIRMPGLDGYEVCRRFKADERLCQIPIIFISALSAMEDIANGFGCGGVDYITKPFREQEVLARVNTHIGLCRARAQLTQDITTLKQTQEELHHANQQLSRLIASREEELRGAIGAALGAAEGEARRIGQELHDILCQELVGLLRMAENINVSTTAGTTPDLAPQTAKLAAQASYALRLARGVSHDLTLHELDTFELQDALAIFTERFNGVASPAIELNCSGDVQGFSKEETVHIYRVVREAVINAIRHGNAHTIWIDLIQERGQIVVSVTNDGALPENGLAITAGIGLKQIGMRARLLGATFRLDRDSRGRTVAELVIPAIRHQERL